jgi:hypothetical protein
MPGLTITVSYKIICKCRKYLLLSTSKHDEVPQENAKEIQPLIFQIQPMSSAARLFDEGHILCVLYHLLVILH